MKNLNNFKNIINENITDKRYSAKSGENSFVTSMWGWDGIEIQILKNGNADDMLKNIKKFEKDLEYVLKIKSEDKTYQEQDIQISILYNSKTTDYPTPYDDKDNNGWKMYDEIGKYLAKISSKYGFERNFKLLRDWAVPYKNNEILYYRFIKK